MGRVMALDVGTKTIGVALSDELKMFPTPLTTLSRKGVRQDTEKLMRIINERDVAAVLQIAFRWPGTSEESPHQSQSNVSLPHRGLSHSSTLSHILRFFALASFFLYPPLVKATGVSMSLDRKWRSR